MPVVNFLNQPHHDGSALHIPDSDAGLGDRVRVRLRVPAGGSERSVWVRGINDAEPVRCPARLLTENAHERWYEAEVPLHNPVVSYRWLLDEPTGYRWVNGSGVFSRDVSDAADFRLTSHAPPPAWTREAVVYQIFPDRFARSAAADAHTAPEWAIPTAWDVAPDGRSPRTPYQFYGGDLPGITEHLDHIQALGANTLYLTPFFPGRSNHRYDASTFGTVDPLLGGDDALVALSRAVHERGMRIMGDITTNHTGETHEWFTAANEDPSSVERGFYYWGKGRDGWTRGETLPYVPWLGVKSLPKLNWNAPELWKRMLDGPRSVIGRYVNEPFSLDGWRVDVANMSGRFASDDFAHEIARRVRATVLAANPDGLTVSEHFHDAAHDLMGDGWMSNMNYAAFTRPLWTWIVEPETALDFLGTPALVPRRVGASMIEAMREIGSRVPWKVSANLWNMLASHDTPRTPTVTASREMAEVAVAMLLAYPGTPAFFAGEEGGFTGDKGEAGRKPMPWEQIAAGGGPDWDGAMHASMRSLIAARASSAALREGGLRWAFASDDAVGFLRETDDERVLVVLARAPWEGVVLPTWLASDAPELLGGGSISGTVAVSLTDAGLVVAGDGPGLGIYRLSV